MNLIDTRKQNIIIASNKQYCYIHNIVNVHTTFNDDTMNSNTAAILIETKKELKKQDKLENIERRKRIDEFIRLQTLQKIASDDARTARIKKTKLQDQKIKPTDFHLLVDHLHHKPDARHPMLHAPNIRLGKSRPTRKPRNKTKGSLQHHMNKTTSSNKNKSTRTKTNRPISLVTSAYSGNMDNVNKMLKAAKKKQQNMIRKESHYRKHNHGVHRNSTTLELQRNAKRLSKQVLDIDATDSRGVTALSWASRQGHHEMVLTLLQNDALVSHVDLHTSKTPLHHAAAEGYLSVVRLLIDWDSPLNPEDKRGNTPLILASQSGHDRIVFALLLAGARWDCCNHQQSDAMLVARRLGHLKVVEVIQERLSSQNEMYTPPSLLGPTTKESTEQELSKLLNTRASLSEELESQTYSPEHTRIRLGGHPLPPHHQHHQRKMSATEILHRQTRNKIHLTQEEKFNTVKHMRSMTHRHHRKPTGFGRDPNRGLNALDRVRYFADPNNRGEQMERDHKRNLANEWEIEWGRKNGETKSERMIRLGDRENKIPGQCPHLERGQNCYSMRELGTCEYLHIPERPHIQIKMNYK